MPAPACHRDYAVLLMAQGLMGLERQGGVETSGDLVQRCSEAMRAGRDFPTVWHTILRGHWLVRGAPEQHMEAGRSQLHILLATGQRLVFDSDAKTFCLR